jgi:hypothetical protein
VGIHGRACLPPGIPDQDPGQLVEQHINLQPPGNTVRSYLDVVAPDEVFWPEIRPVDNST